MWVRVPPILPFYNMKKKCLIRKQFKDSVLKRDKYKCVFCEETKELDAHHITDRKEMLNGGYVLSNGITLCENHHWHAEQFHISGGKTWIDGFHPLNLYMLINSSKEKAIEDSLKL